MDFLLVVRVLLLTCLLGDWMVVKGIRSPLSPLEKVKSYAYGEVLDQVTKISINNTEAKFIMEKIFELAFENGDECPVWNTSMAQHHILDAHKLILYYTKDGEKAVEFKTRGYPPKIVINIKFKIKLPLKINLLLCRFKSPLESLDM